MRLSGYESEELLGRDAATFSNPALRAFLRQVLEDPQRPRALRRDADLTRKDGTTIAAELSSIPVQADGDIALFVTIADLSPRREELRDLERDFRSLFEHNPDGVGLLSVDGVILDVNPAAAKMSVRDRDAIVGTEFTAFLPPEETERSWSFFRRAVAGEPVRFEVEATRGDGLRFNVDATLLPKYAHGAIVAVYCLLQDVTDRRTAARKLELQAQRIRDLYLLATTAEYTDAQVMATLQMGCRMLGMESGAIVDATGAPRVEMRYDTLELFSGEETEPVRLAMEVLGRDEPVVSAAGWIGTRLIVGGALQGALIFFSRASRAQRFEEVDHDTLALMAALIGSAFERRRTRAHLRTLAYYDPLTGLPNRLFFQERLRDALVDSRGHARRVAVLFFDLDRFKDINDTLGHAMGDRFLQIVADRLVRALGTDGMVARSGGDEFIALTRCEGVDDVKRMASMLLSTIDEPYHVDGYEQFLTTSIGAAIYPDDGRDDQMLIKNADIAMYRAKDRGGNTAFFYTEALETPIRNRLAHEKGLRAALERDEFILHFQPIVDVASGQVVSVEALVRWHHPERGLVYPDEFIPISEASGLIVPLGEWVIERAAQRLPAWRERFGPIGLAVNISGRQFHLPDLCDRLRAILERCGVEPSWLDLEITESTAIADTVHAVDTVRALKRLGTRIAVDDFGTGHSSLSYLRRFDVDQIKIDRSFVAAVGNGTPSDETIVKAIIAMGHSLGLKVVAEGVETAKQLAFLRTHGCDRVQGYLFSPPVDAAGLERALAVRGTGPVTG